MKEPKVTPSDLKEQAEELIRSGKMPKLEDLLDAVESTRRKHKPAIEAARSQGQEPEKNYVAEFQKSIANT